MPDSIFFISKDSKRKTWLTVRTLSLSGKHLYKLKLKNSGVLFKTEEQSCIQKPESWAPSQHAWKPCTGYHH